MLGHFTLARIFRAPVSCFILYAHSQTNIRGKKMSSYNLREHKPHQMQLRERPITNYDLRPLKPKQKQGKKRTINDAEEGRRPNPLIEAPNPAEEQPIPQELLESTHDSLFLENPPKRQWTMRYYVAKKSARSQGSTSRTSFKDVPKILSYDEDTEVQEYFSSDEEIVSDEETEVSEYLLSDEEIVEEQVPENPSSVVESVLDQVTENLSAKEVIGYDQAQENPLSNDEIVQEHPKLSKIKPPSRSDGFKTGKDLRQLLKKASSVLISNIKEASDADEMIDLSSKAFTYFDSIGVDYTPVYKAVCSVIRHHYDKEELAKQKPHPAFATKAMHNQAAVEFSEAKERYTVVNRKLKDARCEFDAITTHLKDLYDKVKKAEAKKTRLQAKVTAAQADKVTCDEAYSNAKSKLQTISPKMNEAQKIINDYERRWKKTMNGLNRSIDELSSLPI